MKSLSKIFVAQINGFSVENHESKSESIYEEIESMHGLIELKQNENFREIWKSNIFQKDLAKSTNNSKKLMQTILRQTIYDLIL